MSFLAGEALEAAEAAYYGSSSFADDIAYWLGERAGENLHWLVPLGTGVMSYEWLKEAKKKRGHLVAESGSGSGGGDTILSRGNEDMNFVTPDEKRRKFTGDYSGPLVPYDDSEDMSEGSSGGVPTYKYDHKFTYGGLFSNPYPVRIIGDPDKTAQHGSVRFPPVKGWGFDMRRYKFLRKMWSPVKVMIGDICTTDAATSTAPGWIESAAIADLATCNKNIQYWSDLVTSVAKQSPTAQSTLQVNGLNCNEFADICFPLFPFKNYGKVELGTAGATYSQRKPIGIVDLFARLTDDGTDKSTMLSTYGAGPWTLKAYPDNPYGVVGPTDPGGYDDTSLECYVNVQFEFRLANVGSVSQTVELLQCLPRHVTINSPLYDIAKAHSEGLSESGSFDADSYQWQRIGRNPWEYDAFKKKWRVRKKVITIVPGAVAFVKLSVPMSKVNYMVLQKLAQTEGFCSLPGLTQWLWIRTTGVYGADAGTGFVGHGRGVINMQLYQKVSCLKGIHLQKKIIDLVSNDKSTSITVDEKLAEDDQLVAVY